MIFGGLLGRREGGGVLLTNIILFCPKRTQNPEAWVSNNNGIPMKNNTIFGEKTNKKMLKNQQN